MSLSDPILFEPDKHSDLIPQFTRIHIQCVLQDHVVATFLPPFDVDEHAVDQKVLSYWKSHADQIRKGTRFLIFPLAGDQVAGYVTVGLPSTPTIGFRGEVEKLLVDPTHRRKGIAKTLMLALEKEAKSRGRDLLVSPSSGCGSLRTRPTVLTHRPDVGRYPRFSSRAHVSQVGIYQDRRDSRCCHAA